MDELERELRSSDGNSRPVITVEVGKRGAESGGTIRRIWSVHVNRGHGINRATPPEHIRPVLDEDSTKMRGGDRHGD